LIERRCIQCGSDISHRSRGARYCGPRCQDKARYIPRRAAVICKRCGKDIPKERPGMSTYCSVKCAYAAKGKPVPTEIKPINCKNCSRRYTPKQQNTKGYCCAKCARQSKGFKLNKCSMCNAEFIKIGNKTTCSNACLDAKKRAAHNIRTKRHRQKYYAKTILRSRLHSRISSSIRKRNGATKSAKTEDLLGCSIIEAKNHIEKLFTDGMSWENINEWHIDHKRPCASFDLTDPEQQKECFHYTNLQPLWAKDNLSKGAR